MGLLGGVLKIGASILGGSSAKKASKKAQVAQLESLQKAIDLLTANQKSATEQSAPYTGAGASATNALAALLGLGDPDAQQSAIDGLLNSPLYESLFRNGENTVLANASATGGLRGGNTQASLYNLGKDTLSDVIQNQIKNLGGLSTLGLNATQGLEGLSADNAQAIAALFGKQGDTKAGGILQRSAITSNMFNSVAKEAGSLADSIAGLF